MGLKQNFKTLLLTPKISFYFLIILEITVRLYYAFIGKSPLQYAIYMLKIEELDLTSYINSILVIIVFVLYMVGVSVLIVSFLISSFVSSVQLLEQEVEGFYYDVLPEDRQEVVENQSVRYLDSLPLGEFSKEANEELQREDLDSYE